MNKELQAVIEVFKNKAKDLGRGDYNSCYDSFLDYLNTKKYDNKSLKEIFDIISLADIELACKHYYDSSKKTKSYTAIHRFLLSMDFLYKNCLSPKGIKCEALLNGCNKKETVLNIAYMINKIDKSKIYLPLEEEKIKTIEKCVKQLKVNKFYHLEQKIIYKLLISYGFKEYRITNMKCFDFDEKDKTIKLVNDEYDAVLVRLDDDDYNDLLQLKNIHKYKNRVYLFTNTSGKKLESSSILCTLKGKVIKEGIEDFYPTSIGLYGVINLIKKGLTLSEIIVLTGFDALKIKDVTDYMLLDKDISNVINGKLI
jgi:hypothetical protein